MRKPMNRFRNRSLLIAAGIAVLSALPAIPTPSQRASGAELSADWPTWRGPARDDLSKDTGLLKEWPKDGPPLAWETKGLGGGFSGVSIADGKIFTMGDDDNGIESVIALNAADGKKLWSTKIGPQGRQDKDKAGSRSTPAVDGEFVYAMDPTGDVACFKIGNGEEVWHVHR
jgi:outer membrane protein assembly factor BamB